MSLSATDRVLDRLRAEYLEMPGLRLKEAQVARLCGVEHAACRRALDALVDARFLCVKADGAYGRVTDGAYVRPRTAKADLKPVLRAMKAS